MDRILIINPFGIGDVLFTTPVISNLRRAYPQSHIAYIGNRRTWVFLKSNPKINQVLVYERDEFYAVYKRNPLAFLKKWVDFIKEIKAGRFDAVFDYSLNSTFGLICLVCGIPRRFGYDYRGRGKFLTHRFPLKGFDDQHVIEYHLDLLRAANIKVVDQHTDISIHPEDDAWARQWLKVQGIPQGKKLVAVIPGGGQSWGRQAYIRRWPAEKYVDLVDKIIADYAVVVILMGDTREKQLCQELAAQVQYPVYSAVGQTTLVQMAALFKLCDLAIVNDGGPLHVAVAAGIKTVSVFGPVDDRVYGPYPAARHQVVKLGLPCQPCYRRFRVASCAHLSCLRDLPVADVYRKVSVSL